MGAPTSPTSDHAADVDSECILNDDEIATIDGGHRSVATSATPSPTTMPQVRCLFVLFYTVFCFMQHYAVFA